MYVSDASGGENSRRPYLWEYRQEHREVVSAALEQRFDVSGENGLADQMERVAAQLVDEYWHDNRRDIVGIVDGSFLEDYDEFNIGAAFRNAAVSPRRCQQHLCVVVPLRDAAGRLLRA